MYIYIYSCLNILYIYIIIYIYVSIWCIYIYTYTINTDVSYLHTLQKLKVAGRHGLDFAHGHDLQEPVLPVDVVPGKPQFTKPWQKIKTTETWICWRNDPKRKTEKIKHEKKKHISGACPLGKTQISLTKAWKTMVQGDKLICKPYIM